MTFLDPEINEYLSKWKYVEIAHYVDSLGRVIRDQSGTKGNKIPIFLEPNEIESFRAKNNNLGIYTSVWLYDSKDIDTTKRLGSIYFDFDSDIIEEAQQDTINLVTYLSEFISDAGIRIYFTGAKGFHVEVEAVTAGITPTNTLPDLFRFIATELKDKLSLSTLDFSVYDQRRMWRLPNSIHQKTGLYKIPITSDILNSSMDEIRELAKNPIEENISTLSFEAKANAWYRDWIYQQETQKEISLEERIARFNKMGTNAIHKAYDTDLVFDPASLFKNCPSILHLWDKAEREHHLLHEERLFLCSILTYSDEAIEYLITILSNCNDFNVDKSRSHIDDWVKRRDMGIGGRPFSCARAQSAGVGCTGCELEPKERMERIGDNWVGMGEMAEPSPFRFGYKRKISKSTDPLLIPKDTIKYI